MYNLWSAIVGDYAPKLEALNEQVPTFWTVFLGCFSCLWGDRLGCGVCFVQQPRQSFVTQHDHHIG
jgi:hypothetical protein